MAVRSVDVQATPEAQLRAWIAARFEPSDQRLILAVRSAVRKRLPTANELVYDYGSSVVIGYSPTDRAIDGIVAVAARPDGVRLYFTNGPRLPDPKNLLRGAGKDTRFIEMEAAGQLAHPDIEALIAAAIGQAGVALPAEGGGSVVIKSDRASKPPRRKPAA